MAVWVVTSSGMAVEVDAYKASTSPAGVLVFTDSQGDLVRAFAPGAWSECELKKGNHRGYT
jgi:hypothetical protein